MKVYVVTSGEYSEYHIVGITLDRQVAETFVNSKNEAKGEYGSGFYLEEYETDDFQVIAVGCKPYRACFYGNENGDRRSWADECEWRYQNVGLVEADGHGNYEVIVFAKDEDHALKIGAEKVAEYKARKEGIT